jgi:hypothetical protein
METAEVPHVITCLFPIRPCCTPGKSLAPIAATDHCDQAAYRKEFKEIIHGWVIKVTPEAKRRILSSTRAACWSESYNMSLLPDSSRGSVLLRKTRMGNNVPEKQVAQDRVCTVGTQVLDGCARRAPALPLNTPERFASPSATVPFRRFSCEICPRTNAHPNMIFVIRAGREAKSSNLRV